MTPTPGSSPTAADGAPGPGKIAFTSDRGDNPDIYVVDPDGGEPERVTDDPEVERSPTWSPAGTRITFVRESGIYRINLDGSGERKLTSAHPSSIATSPDGALIAFALGEPEASDIFVMSAGGIGPENLSNSPKTDDIEPAWSPDGDRIVYTSGADIWVMNADGGKPVQLTDDPALDSAPSWSPDGQRIAFTSNRDGNNEVFVMNADGSDPTNLTKNSASDGLPVWSPDGSKLAFVSNRDGNNEVYIMDADGSGQTNLTNNSAEDGVFRIAWSN